MSACFVFFLVRCAFQVDVASVTLTPQDVAMLSWGFSSLSQECLPCQVNSMNNLVSRVARSSLHISAVRSQTSRRPESSERGSKVLAKKDGAFLSHHCSFFFFVSSSGGLVKI